MTATYTFDIFSSLDGFGSHTGNWGGYWGKQGPELLARRLALYSQEQRMVFGANTYRLFAQMLADSTADPTVRDPNQIALRYPRDAAQTAAIAKDDLNAAARLIRSRQLRRRRDRDKRHPDFLTGTLRSQFAAPLIQVLARDVVSPGDVADAGPINSDLA